MAALFDHHVPDDVRPLFCGACYQRWPCDSRDVADSHDALLAAAVAAEKRGVRHFSGCPAVISYFASRIAQVEPCDCGSDQILAELRAAIEGAKS